MCHNHSHLIARFLGENTAGLVPVLTYGLADPVIKIESPVKDGGVLMLRTSGRLYLPSWMLDGLSPSTSRETVARSMSLCFMPDDAQTFMQQMLGEWLNSWATSPAPSRE